MKHLPQILLIVVGVALVWFGGTNVWDAMFPHHVPDNGTESAITSLPWIVSNGGLFIVGWITGLAGILSLIHTRPR